MIEKVLAILQGMEEADGYSVREVKTESEEYFFIRRQLDQSRAKETAHLYAVLYKKIDEEHLGSAQIEIPVSATEAEIRAKISRALLAASYVQNPMYELQRGSGVQEYYQKEDIHAIAKDLIETFHSVSDRQDTWLNSAEIFVNLHHVHAVNSSGVNVKYDYAEFETEFVVDAHSGDLEVEVYRDLHGSTVDRKQIRSAIAEAMATAVDRCHAVPTPNLKKSDIVFSGEAATQIYESLLKLTNAAMLYQKISDWKPSDPVIRKPMQGDLLNLQALASLPGSSQNIPFDEEGRPAESRVLVKEGVVQALSGSKRFCDYIGYDAPLQILNYRADGGTMDQEQILQEPCLELAEFSDFQADAATGKYAGEIRLAYLHENGRVTPVSGGSVAGDVREALEHLRMSRETVRYDHAEIPHYTRIENAAVTGIENR
jgi:predicted Zn-dependent protease